MQFECKWLFSNVSIHNNPKEGEKEHKQDQEDKESKKAVLELVLGRCKTKETASSNSNSKVVRYSMRDATEVCLGHRDSYTVETNIGNFQKSRASDWWNSETENVYGKGPYGTRDAIQALVEFIAQQTPNREILPTPRQAIKSVLDYCEYKQDFDPVDNTEIHYYNVTKFTTLISCCVFVSWIITSRTSAAIRGNSTTQIASSWPAASTISKMAFSGLPKTKRKSL